jgi:hypothetical protein
MATTATSIATPYIVTIHQGRTEFVTQQAAIAFIEAAGATITADEKESTHKYLEAGHTLDFVVAPRVYAQLYDARAQAWPYMQEHGHVEVSDAQKTELGNAVRELSGVLGTTLYHCSPTDADDNYATVKAVGESLNSLLIESGLLSIVPAGETIQRRPVTIQPDMFLAAISKALSALCFMRVLYTRYSEHNTRVIDSAESLLAKLSRLPA